MYNVIEYNDNYSKTSGGLWQYCKDIPAVNNNGNIVDFRGANATTNSLVNLEVNFILTWSENCVIIGTNVVNQVPTFEITETSLYVPVVTLASEDNAKLLSQLKSGFKRTINWNKHLSKLELLPQNPNLNHLIEPSLQGVNKIFVLAFENDAQRTSNKRYLPNVEIKHYNDRIFRNKFFNQPVKNNKITYENVRKIATGQGDDYKTGCLLDYTYFKNICKIIAVDKACFQYEMGYGDFKDFAKRTASDKVLRVTAFNIAKSPTYDGY